MLISVIIVSWNTRDLTLAAVASALRQEVDAAVEVIVVDNHSRDDTVAALRATYPTVRVIQTGRNLGFAGGNNVGLRQARGDYTLLLNSDAVIRPGALQALVDTARAHPEAGAFQPKLILPDGSVQLSWDYVPTLWQELRLVLWYARHTRGAVWQAKVRSWREPRRVRAVGLSALMLPTWVWGRIGLLSTNSFLYFEEMELSVRLQRHGLPMWLVPAAEVEHWVGQSTGQVPLVRRRSHYLSRMWFYNTYRDRGSAAVVRLLSRLRSAVGLVRGDEQAAEELWRPVHRAACQAEQERSR